MASENINRRLNIYINDREIINSSTGINREMAKVRNQIKNLNKGAADYDQQLAKLKNTYSQLQQKQKEFRDDMAQTKSILGSIKSALGPVGTGFLAAFSITNAASSLKSALSSAYKTINTFEQSVADLSAITGATGKDLNYLKNQAIELGKETVGGAAAVVEAYKLIASAKPELLNNVKALNEVTSATILLSKASGMELPQAATALTDAMNQFGVPAEKAVVFVDSLANGAKYGAAEIPQITEALLKFGAVARNSNIDIHQSTALIELLAENGLKGAEAGTALRNVLLKLSAPDALPKEAVAELKKLGISMSFLKDKTIPFQEKMEALKPLVKDNASIVKIFGNENATAAINVLSHTERLAELTSKMKEVGTAQEQAAIKMDTVENKTKLLNAKYDSLILSINKGSGVVSNFFKFFIDGASDAVESLTRLNTSWDELYSISRDKGQQNGKQMFLNQFRNLEGTGSDADISESIKTVAEKNYKIYEKQYAENARKLREFKENAFRAARTYGVSEDDLKEEKEKLIKNLNEQATIIREAKEKINKTIAENKPNPIIDKIKTTSDPLTEEEKKKRARELEEAKKHSEELLKEYQQSQKELLDAQRSLQDVQLASQKESYEKERKELNLAYDRKIEDTKIKQKEIQSEIDKLTQEKKDPKNSKSDVALLQKQIDAKLELQKIYNKISNSLEEERTFKLATLQNKYLQKEIDEREDAHNKELKLLKERQDYELEGISSLQEAKAVLQNYLSEEELKNIKTLEEAKRAIKEQHLKEEYAMQEAYLIDSIAKIQALFAQEDFTGVPILTEEGRAALTQFLDVLAEKLGNIQKAKGNIRKGDNTTKDLSTLSGIDILGFNPEQWQSAFDNLDTWAEKLEAVGTVIGGIKNAFGMYFQFLEAGDKRSLQKFEANNKKKQKELALQLEKGYITQEVYNARKEKLDQDLARKQAELEYKQAKREKLMNIANIIGNNAMAVSKALAQGGFIFGIPWAAIVGALGAVQLAAALAQPLPPKNPGFRDGGYTGDGPDTGVAGDAHFQEYVTPRKVLFSNDPLVPSIIGYLEAKRTGKVTATSSSGNYSAPIQSITSPENLAIQQKTNESLDKLNILLEKLGEGIPAYLENDLRTAKKIRRKLNELQTLENQTKS